MISAQNEFLSSCTGFYIEHGIEFRVQKQIWKYVHVSTFNESAR